MKKNLSVKVLSLVTFFAFGVTWSLRVEAQQPSKPFKALEGGETTVETVRHQFELAETGLPKQIRIKPVKRELPLEARENPDQVANQVLQRRGRGSQLRSPVTLQATVKGQKAGVKVSDAAERVEKSNGQWTYESSFTTGPVSVDLTARYRYDGTIVGTISYSGDGTAIDSLELEMPVAGPVSLAWNGVRTGKQGIESTSGLQATLSPETDKVVWTNTSDRAKNRGSKGSFVGYFFFGSPDRGFTWMSPGGNGWQTDDSKPMMEVERDENGLVTWRVKLVNSKTNLSGSHEVNFSIQVHPARPPEPNRRKNQWLSWPVDKSPEQKAPSDLSVDALDGSSEVSGALSGGVLEPTSTYRELSGAAGANMNSAEKDTIDLYENSLFTVFAGTYTGQTTRVRANVSDVIGAGDNPAFDRHVLGRALIHDIGVAPQSIVQPIQYVRLVRELKEFGFFKEKGTEVLPYWRNDEFVRYGEEYGKKSRFALSKENPTAGVYVTVYRRPLKDGGYKALFVLMNTRDESIRERLHVLKPQRIFGGGNQLTWPDIVRDLDFSGTDGAQGTSPWADRPSDWRKSKILGSVEGMALKDLEEDGTVLASEKQPSSGEIYGPVFIRPHDYRILYGYSSQ